MGLTQAGLLVAEVGCGRFPCPLPRGAVESPDLQHFVSANAVFNTSRDVFLLSLRCFWTKDAVFRGDLRNIDNWSGFASYRHRHSKCTRPTPSSCTLRRC